MRCPPKATSGVSRSDVEPHRADCGAALRVMSDAETRRKERRNERTKNGQKVRSVLDFVLRSCLKRPLGARGSLAPGVISIDSELPMSRGVWEVSEQSLS